MRPLGDPSVLGHLLPNHPLTLAFRAERQSPRPQGSHLARYKRPARELESARDYVAGDPIQRIDWRAFARTDQLIIRERRDEAMATVAVVLDLSKSLFWPTPDLPIRGVVTKAEVAWRIALHLAHLHGRQGDLVELWTVPAAQSLPTRVITMRSAQPSLDLMDQLAREEFAEGATTALGDERHWPSKKFALVYLLSDLLAELDVEVALSAGRQAMVIQVLSSLERDISWTLATTSYVDEAQAQEYLGATLKDHGGYLAQLAAWQARQAAAVRRLGGAWLSVTEATPVATLHGALLEWARARPAQQR